MSADNFYVIRRHPAGGFAAVMGFASCDDDWEGLRATARHTSFATLDQALEYALGEYSEYGVSVHPECHQPEQPEQPEQPAVPAVPAPSAPPPAGAGA